MSHPLEDLPTLRDFGDQLAALAAAEPAARPPWTGRLRLRRRRLSLVLVAATALVIAASAAAATLVGLRTTVVPGPEPVDVAPEELIVAGSAHLLPVRARDPFDGSVWTLRAARSRSGEVCLTVGQRRGATFGLVGLDGRYRLLAASIVDGCSAAKTNDVSLLGARVFDARRRRDVRTVIYGIAGGALRAVDVRAGDGIVRSVPVTRGGAFATVLAGYPEDRPVRLSLRFADGHLVTRDFGRSRQLVTGPGHTPALRLNGFVIDSALTTQCLTVSAARHVAGAGSGPAICGSSKPARPFGAVRAVRPGRHGTPSTGGYSWGSFPARTLVYGSWPRLGPRLRAVIVRAPTGTVRARIIRARDFLAVLPARARPAAVTVTVVPQRGAPVTFRDSLNLVPNPLTK